MNLVRKYVAALVLLVSLAALSACSKPSEMIQALETAASNKDRAPSHDVSGTAKRYISIGISEVAAGNIVASFGFREKFRTESIKLQDSIWRSDEYIGYEYRYTEVPIVLNHVFTLIVGLQDGEVNYVHCSVRYYTFGIN